jgi:DNA-binding MarR family transcriptional regulator
VSAALDLCRAIHAAQCSLQLKLDEELGTLHGIGWNQFNLLAALDDAGGSLPLLDLPRPLGLPRSGVVRMLLPLEKVGLVAREAVAHERRVRLCSGGRRVLHEARETAAGICGAALADPWPLEGAQSFLRGLAASPALDLR